MNLNIFNRARESYIHAGNYRPGIWQFVENQRNYPKIVVSDEHSFENTYEGIEHIYILNFLSGTISKSIIN